MNGECIANVYVYSLFKLLARYETFKRSTCTTGNPIGQDSCGNRNNEVNR